MDGAHRDAGGAGLIGPNAVLQLLEVLDRREGPRVTARLMAEAGLVGPPSGCGLMPEEPAHRLHRALRRALPDRAPDLLAEAGARTADYILAHRIPAAARAALRLMPEGLATRALSRAIARHAWTFAGSGRFAMLGPGRFELYGNPLIAGEPAPAPLCHWHAAVFARLFQRLVSDRLGARETDCAACGAASCRFVVD